MLIDDVIADYFDGIPLREIYKKHNIKLNDLNFFLKERNIPKRSRNAPNQRLQNKTYGKCVQCMICNAKFQCLSNHVKIHGLSPKEYVAQFNEPLMTMDCHERNSLVHIEKFNKLPHLRENLREVGRKNIQKVNASGKGWRMPKGFHTEEHKQKMCELMTGRNVTWGDKISTSHWSKGDKAKEIIDLICSQSNRFHNGWYCSNKTSKNEFYHSSYELRRMKELDLDDNVLLWTKDHDIVMHYQHNGKEKKYIPDFLIQYNDGRKTLEEIKGYIKDVAQYDSKCSAARTYCSIKNMEFIVNFMKQMKNE
jgi:TnsA-like endonuclease N terminal